MIVLGFDTSTPATAVALLGADGTGAELRHDPASGQRPGHASQLLALAERVLTETDTGWPDVERIAVGAGPGTFTGLRIGIATARALAQGRDLPLVAVSSLAALAAPAREAQPGRVVVAVLDARRGEAFAAAWAGDREVMGPAALDPDALAERASALPSPLAVGNGALAFRAQLEAVAVEVPDAGSPLHLVSALAVCRAGAEAPSARLESVLPDYVRAPDAERRRP